MSEVPSIKSARKLKVGSIRRIALSLIGLAIVLWPERPSPEYTLLPWLVGALIFGLTLLLFEVVLRRLKSDHSMPAWMTVGYSIGYALLFSVAYLFVAIVLTLILGGFESEIGYKLLNSVSWNYYLSFAYGFVYGASYLFDALFSKCQEKG